MYVFLYVTFFICTHEEEKQEYVNRYKTNITKIDYVLQYISVISFQKDKK